MTTDHFTYETVHIYLKRDHGDPREMKCVSCGEWADEWAYDHGDPDQLVSPKGRPYSMKPEHYRPMCRPCHRRADAGGDETCRKGHPWTMENTYVHRGQRFCRECRRIYSNDYYHRVVKMRRK